LEQLRLTCKRLSSENEVINAELLQYHEQEIRTLVELNRQSQELGSVQSLKNDLARTQEELKTTLAALNEATASLHTVKANCAELEAKLATTLNANTCLETKLAMASNQLVQFEERQQAHATLPASEPEPASSCLRCTELESQLKSSKADLSKTNLSLEACLTNHSALLQEVAKLKSDVSSLQKERDTVVQNSVPMLQHTQLTSQLRANATALQQAEIAKSDAENRCRQLALDLATYKQQADSSIEAHKNELIKANERLRAAEQLQRATAVYASRMM
jgi:hypothetical protein